MVQTLSDVYANVRDSIDGSAGARGNGTTDDTASIEAAIASGKHVLFPKGTYVFSGRLEFYMMNQRCTFLAGAVLVPSDSDAYVRIGFPSVLRFTLSDPPALDQNFMGGNQTFIGLRVEAPPEVLAHSPLIQIYGAANLLMQGLRVSVAQMDYPRDTTGAVAPGPKSAVQVMRLVNCKFIGGIISGNHHSGTIGLWLANSYDYHESDLNPNPGQWWAGLLATPGAVATAQAGSGANEIAAFGLRLEAFGWAVRISCITDDPTFVNCVFSDVVDGALAVRDDADVLDLAGAPDAPGDNLGFPEVAVVATVAKALTLLGCHMSGGSPPRYVYVQRQEIAPPTGHPPARRTRGGWPDQGWCRPRLPVRRGIGRRFSRCRGRWASSVFHAYGRGPGGCVGLGVGG